MAMQRERSCTTTHKQPALEKRGLSDAASTFDHHKLQESKMPRDVVTPVEPTFSARAFSPAAFVRQLMDAVVAVMPLDDREPHYSQPGPVVEARTTFRVLEPFLASFTVADAGLLLNMIYAFWGLQRNARDSDVDGEALGRIQSLLEDFLADGHASTPQCTEVRAHFIEMCMDDAYNHPSDCTVDGLRSQALGYP